MVKEMKNTSNVTHFGDVTTCCMTAGRTDLDHLTWLKNHQFEEPFPVCLGSVSRHDDTSTFANTAQNPENEGQEE